MNLEKIIEKQFNKCSITGNKFERGSYFEVDIYTVKPDAEANELALYVLLEHSFDTMSVLLKQLMLEELIPFGVVVFIRPGVLNPSISTGTSRNMRAVEFDQYGPDFSNFLVEELVPEVCLITGETLSSNPDMHFICGGSSGGMAAWNAVWFRNDYFRRAFLSSPTFSAMRGGEEAMVIARKTETKPIKLYITCGTEEPDYYFGSSLLAAQNAASALEFAGYDFRFEQFNGEGHCCRRDDTNLWRRMMGFLWANWETVPVKPFFNQIRIKKLIASGSTWQQYKGTFPERQPVTFNGGTYTFSSGKIYFEKDGVKQIAAEGFEKITALGISSDKWRLYIADSARRFIYAMSIFPDGSLDQCYKLAPLHLQHDFTTPGALDITVLADDRILAATELGIQGVVSFGLTDLILPLPGDLPAERVTVCQNMLYVASGEQIFVRELKISEGKSDTVDAPASPGYGDGFSYRRSHLFFS